LALHNRGLKAPMIQTRLVEERADWWTSSEAIRQVISRARRAGALRTG
jgi:hypothetical protein